MRFLFLIWSHIQPGVRGKAPGIPYSRQFFVPLSKGTDRSVNMLFLDRMGPGKGQRRTAFSDLKWAPGPEGRARLPARATD